MADESQGKRKKRRGKFGVPEAKGSIQNYAANLARGGATSVSAPGPIALPPRPPNMYLNLNVRLEQRLVMTPTLGFGNDQQVKEAIQQMLVLDPDKVV